MTIESKKAEVNCAPQRLYEFAANFNNFARIMPSGAQNFTSTYDTCSFNVSGFMQINLRYAQRTPYSAIVIEPDTTGATPMAFQMKLGIDDLGNNRSRIHIDFDMPGANPMVNMMLKPKLKQAADSLIDQLQYFGNAM